MEKACTPKAEPEFTIVLLEWERIFLNFTIETAHDKFVEFAFMNKNTDKMIPILYDRKEEGRYYFSINMVAVYDRTYLDNGKWQFIVIADNSCYPCLVASDVAYRIDQLTRVFRYGKLDKYAYTVSFTIEDRGEKDLLLFMHSDFMTRNDEWYKRKYMEEVESWRGRLYKCQIAVFSAMAMALYRICHGLSKKTGKRILIMAETKDYLWGNLKAIDEGIKERGLDKEYKITYSFRRSVDTPQSVLSWFKLIYKISVQDIIFVDDFVPVFNFLKLDPEVKLVQVWHAGAGFKAVGYCRFGKDGSPYPVGVCHKAYTHAMIGSRQLVKVFEEVFGIEKAAIYPVGMARLDHFLDEKTIQETRARIYMEYPFLQEKKIILFAPTYRGTGQETAYYSQKKIDMDQIYELCAEEYLFLIKMHPFITERFEIPKAYQDRIIEFSDYKHINDLYYITEILITDYSSNFYEFSLMKKPILFYTYDRAVYELSRGVYRSIRESAPGKVCDTFDELMKAIRTKDFELEKVERFVAESFDELDGKATERIIDKVLLDK